MDKTDFNVTQHYTPPADTSDEDNVTQHYLVTPEVDDAAVTQIYPAAEANSDADVTQIYVPPSAVAPQPKRGSIAQQSLIAEVYRVLSEPLGGVTGEAEVYHCHDTQYDRSVALKLYHHNTAPKESVLKQMQGLSHPNVVRLMSYGTWSGRFYEVMEFCQGGAMSDLMPLSLRKLKTYLPDIINGLDYCHQQGVIHRDIKPNNLFFRDPAHTEPVIGDFGISSFLEEKNTLRVRVTQSAANLTIDYASPELLDGHEVSPKTDYYALGLTLLHLATGRSPFKGLTPNDILVAHLRGKIPLPDNAPPEFVHLIRGLTVWRPEQRWGYAEVLGWLNGEAVPVPEDSSPVAIAARQHPYPGYPEAKNLQELALALDQFDAAKHLLRGDIRRWVFDHYDAAIAEKLAHIEEQYSNNTCIALVHTRYALFPNAPLQVGANNVNSIPELVALLEKTDNVLQQALSQALFKTALECWIDNANAVATERRPALLKKIRDIRTRYHADEYHSVALFALLYTLDPHRPLPLTDNIDLTHPRELGKIIRQQPKITEEPLQHLIFSRKLEEWLRAAQFEGWKQDERFIADARTRYIDNHRLGGYAVLWYYTPTLPFPFSKKIKVKTPLELARVIETNPQCRQRGLDLLEQGLIRAWLVGANMLQGTDAIQAFDHAILRIDATPESKLEAVLHLLDPHLPHPKMLIEPHNMNFGRLTFGAERTLQLRIKNVGRGYLYGNLEIEQSGRGFTVDHYAIEGNGVIINVTATSISNIDNQYQRTNLIIKTNAGEQSVLVSYIAQTKREKNRGWLGALSDFGFNAAWLRRVRIPLFIMVIIFIGVLSQCQVGG